MSLIPEITAEQIDDFFKVGRKKTKVVGVKASTTGGRILDPKTMKPAVINRDNMSNLKRCRYTLKIKKNN